MVINGIHIGDIHFNAFDSKRLYRELEKVFFKYLDDVKDCQYILINGDVTHNKVSLNEGASKFLIKFFDKLCKKAKKRKIKIRIIKGTKSHDLDQLEAFDYYSKVKNLDFRIIRTVCEEELFKNFKVLYIPEEYMENKEEYYKEFLNKEDNYYDLVAGHGTFNFLDFSINSEKNMKNAPVFTYSDFKNICAGPVIFAHYHIASKYKNIYYTGSFSRWCFGEEKDKSFIHMKYSTKNNSYKIKRIKNNLARKFVTINLKDTFKNNELTSKEKIEIIENIKKETKYDFIRFEFNKEDLKDEGEILILKDYFQQNNDIKLSITNKLKREETDEDIEIEKKFSFIFDKNRNLEDIVSKYLDVSKSIKISAKEIKTFLTEKEGN